MSFEHDQARLIAQRIAQRMAQGTNESHPSSESTDDLADELAALRARLDELQKKMAGIESKVPQASEFTRGASRARYSEQANAASSGEPNGEKSAMRSPWLSGVYFPATHPSQEKFGVDEAAVSELVDFFEGEKKCELEPGGRPCDHCAMCSSRGF